MLLFVPIDFYKCSIIIIRWYGIGDHTHTDEKL
jgi:hypothetical protein